MNALKTTTIYLEYIYIEGLLKENWVITGAILDFNKAIKLDSTYALSYSSRGNAKAKIKDYKGAIYDFDKSILLDPLFSISYSDRGTAKVQLLIIR